MNALLRGAWALGLSFTAMAAQAALFDDNEARRQIAQLRTQVEAQQRSVESRVGELEATLRSRSVVDLFNQVEALKADVAKLRGQTEVYANDLDNLQKRQRDLYVDADTRLRKLEGEQSKLIALVSEMQKQNAELLARVDANQKQLTSLQTAATAAVSNPASSQTTPPGVSQPTQASVITSTGAIIPAPQATQGGVGAVGTGAPTATTVDLAGEQRAYDAALAEFRSGRYDQAAAAFNGFVRTYPRSALASSAQYWVGNSLYAKRDYRGAISAQRALIAQYPDSSKVPDALLNIASAYSELGDTREARRAHEEIVAKHPSSEAAQKARQRLAGR